MATTTKKQNFKGQSIEALAKALSEKQTALRNFRFGSAGSKAKNVREGRAIRRDIARIMTEVRAQKA